MSASTGPPDQPSEGILRVESRWGIHFIDATFEETGRSDGMWIGKVSAAGIDLRNTITGSRLHGGSSRSFPSCLNIFSRSFSFHLDDLPVSEAVDRIGRSSTTVMGSPIDLVAARESGDGVEIYRRFRISGDADLHPDKLRLSAPDRTALLGLAAVIAWRMAADRSSG